MCHFPNYLRGIFLFGGGRGSFVSELIFISISLPVLASFLPDIRVFEV